MQVGIQIWIFMNFYHWSFMKIRAGNVSYNRKFNLYFDGADWNFLKLYPWSFNRYHRNSNWCKLEFKFGFSWISITEVSWKSEQGMFHITESSIWILMVQIEISWNYITEIPIASTRSNWSLMVHKINCEGSTDKLLRVHG